MKRSASLTRKSGLRSGSQKPAVPLQQSFSRLHKSPVGRASVAQRAKVRDEDKCRTCGYSAMDPAHVIPRANGGCDDPLCVIPLCRICHELFDQARGLEILGVLSLEEQAHAVKHVGILRALQRVTGLRWVPGSKP